MLQSWWCGSGGCDGCVVSGGIVDDAGDIEGSDDGGGGGEGLGACLLGLSEIVVV